MQLHADLETPVTAYLKLRQMSGSSFLYESVEGPQGWADVSILGFGAKRVFNVSQNNLTVTEGQGSYSLPSKDPLTAIREALKAKPLVHSPDATPCVGGIFGFLSYDAARSFEPLQAHPSTPQVPDAYFLEPTVVAVFYHRQHSIHLYTEDATKLEEARRLLRGPLPPYQPSQGWSPPVPIDSRPAFENAVNQAKSHIRAGDIIQVVLSRRFELPKVADPFNVYRGLRTINPSPYLYYFECPEVQISGASPEVMVRVRNNKVTVRPIAGTRPRGKDDVADALMAQELLADPKERAEHIMLVDLGRNDVGKIATPGTVHVPHFMTIENYSHVMHIVSQVEGELAAKNDCFDALRAAFPAGTLSGAPKVRAMQIIDELESDRRGIYGGAVGYLGPQGNADFGIAIRTLVAHKDRFIVQAGAGIVADSDPSKEADETEHKAQAVLRAAQWATSPDASW